MSGLTGTATDLGVELQPLARVERERLRPSSIPAHYALMETALARAAEKLGGRTVWHVNAHVVGGVTETLRALLGLMRDGQIDARWAALRADGEFIALTQRLYEDLAGEAREFDGADRVVYEERLRALAEGLANLVVEGDVVVLYDSPTAGLAPTLREHGARVVWRCHVGHDEPHRYGRDAQAFLQRYLEGVVCVFPRAEFIWPTLAARRSVALSSSINPISAKNQELDAETVNAILHVVGLADEAPARPAVFTRLDGSPWRIDRPAAVEQQSFVPAAAPVVSHVSSWDPLKDPAGVIETFARFVDPPAHLVIAGPDPIDTSETPGAVEVRAGIRAAVDRLDAGVRERVHVVSIPTDDLEENAACVNAIQRRADVFVRKSLSEGFGLSIAESMWKAKPAVASRLGGIQELVVDGDSGILIGDPSDLSAFGAAVTRLLADPELAHRLGEAARHRIQEHYLTDLHLTRYLNLITSV